jgi:putative flavoprotein involved in K+ transport
MITPIVTKRIQTVIIGAGQAGLSVGYHLARRKMPFVILEANERVGDTWRNRWDSLRLFTPARYDGLVGMKFPAPRFAFPTKDEMGDFLERYAKHFALPVETGVKVDRVSRRGQTYVISAGATQYEAEHVVVAMANFQQPLIPEFANDLSADIVQLHSKDYRNPSQLKPGGVLIVGAGNSGAEIAIELARRGHPTWMAGRSTGEIPFRGDSFLGRHVLFPLVLRGVFHHVLTTKTPMGRRARPVGLPHGGPLIRQKRKQLAAAGVTFVPKVAGVRDGHPVLDGDRVLDVANVIWCTGFQPGFSWIDIPVFGPGQQPVHERGVVTSEPGLYFIGLHFLHSFSSTMIHGAARDSEYIANALVEAVGRKVSFVQSDRDATATKTAPAVQRVGT